MGLKRVPFSQDQLEEVVDFSLGRGMRFDAPLLRRLILQMTSDPAGVFVVRDDAGIKLAAVVIDRAEIGGNGARLEIIGVGEGVSSEALLELVVEPAIQFAARGVRSALHFEIRDAVARIDGAEALLRRAGFAPCYEGFTMRRPADAAAPEPAGPLPDGWRWETVDLRRAEAAHAALREMFRGALGTAISPLATFREVVAWGRSIWRVLLDGENVAGLTHVVPHATHGEIRTVGRHPRYRGRGLGPRLVAEGLRVALAGGPRPVELDVEVENERALTLYRRFGFVVVSRTPVLALNLALRRAVSDATS